MSKKKEVTIEDKLKGAIIPKEEQPYEIPNNWKWIKLNSFTKIISKGTTPKGGESSYKKTGIKFLRVENLNNDSTLNFENIKYIDEDTHKGFLKRSILLEEDVLISIAGTLGKTAIVKKEDLPLNTNQAICFIRLQNKNMILPKYLCLLYNSSIIRGEILKKAKVTAIPNLTLEIIGNTPIPLPPLEEQERIVKKLDSMLGRISEAKELIEQAKETFENRRASILNLAFSGELTRKWRESNSIESSKILLENLNKEKIRLWEEECEKALEEGKKKPSKPKLLSVEEMVISKEEQPYEIPKSWEWIKIERVIQLISGRDVSSNLCNSDEKGIPYILGASNIKENRFLVERWIETPVVISKKNDILLSVKGTIGKIYLQKESEINISRQIMALRAYSVLEKYYLMYFLENNVEKFKEDGNGLIPGISREIILNKLIQLPPLEEQKEIVRILNETLKREKKVKEILEIENMLELLEKSVLDKAFKGELRTQKNTDSNIYDTLKSYNLTKGE